jgi:hypothetical protein
MNDKTRGNFYTVKCRRNCREGEISKKEVNPMTRKKRSLLKKYKYGKVIPAIGFFVLFSLPVFSTTLLKVDFNKLVQDADFIFIGEVVDISYRWGEQGKTLHTYVTFSNLEVLTDNYYEDSYTVKFAGGQKGPYRLEVPGIPLFKIGQRSVIFARSRLNGRALCPFVGWFQGRFKIIKDGDTGIEAVYDDAGRLITGINNFKIQKKYLDKRSSHLNQLTANDFSLHDFVDKIKDRLSVKAAQSPRVPEPVINISIPGDMDFQINETIPTPSSVGKKPKKKGVEM